MQLIMPGMPKTRCQVLASARLGARPADCMGQTTPYAQHQSAMVSTDCTASCSVALCAACYIRDGMATHASWGSAGPLPCMRAAEHSSSSLCFQPAGQIILRGPHRSTQGRRTLDRGAQEQVKPQILYLPGPAIASPPVTIQIQPPDTLMRPMLAACVAGQRLSGLLWPVDGDAG